MAACRWMFRRDEIMCLRLGAERLLPAFSRVCKASIPPPLHARQIGGKPLKGKDLSDPCWAAFGATDPILIRDGNQDFKEQGPAPGILECQDNDDLSSSRINSLIPEFRFH